MTAYKQRELEAKTLGLLSIVVQAFDAENAQLQLNHKTAAKRYYIQGLCITPHDIIWFLI